MFINAVWNIDSIRTVTLGSILNTNDEIIVGLTQQRKNCHAEPSEASVGALKAIKYLEKLDLGIRILDNENHKNE